MTISVSAPVAISGISLGKWESGTAAADVDVWVIEGAATGGRALAHRLLRAVQLNTGGIVPLMLEQPVDLVPRSDYTLALRMRGDMRHQSLSATGTSVESVTSAGAPFTVTFKTATFSGADPLNRNNGTDATSGQIPSLFLSC